MQGSLNLQFQGRFLGDGGTSSYTLSDSFLASNARAVAATPPTLRVRLSAEELGQNSNTPLATILHTFWTGERRRLLQARSQRSDPTATLPVGIESRLQHDHLLHTHYTTPHIGSQPEIPTLHTTLAQPTDPPPLHPLPNPDLLPHILLGTQRVRPVRVRINRRLFISTETITPSGTLRFDRDQVSLRLQGETLF